MLVNAMNIRPYGFDRIFSSPQTGTPVAERKAAPASADAVSLHREMDLMREAHAAELARARADGFQAGLTQARTEREEALLSAMDALHAGFEASDEEQQLYRDTLIRDAAELALSAAETLAGHALERQPIQAIDDAIGRVLGQILRGQEIHIEVHPDLADEVEQRVAERQNRDRRKLRLTVSANESVPRGDARFHWERGGMSLDSDARREAIRAEMMSAFAASEPA